MIPEDKAIAPHARTYVDPKTLKHIKKNGLHHPSSTASGVVNHPFTTLVTSFADDSSTLVYDWQQEELTRRMKLIAGAVGCINLTEVSFVRRSSDMHPSANTHHSTSVYHNDNNIRNNINRSSGSISSDSAASSTCLLAQDEPSSSSSLLLDGHHPGDKQQCGIELVMENGIVIKLEVCNTKK